MNFLKQYPVFTTIVLVCILAAATGIYLTVGERGQVVALQQEVDAQRQALRSAAGQSPAPTEGNLEAARDNLARLRQELEDSIETLEQGRRLRRSDDGLVVGADIDDLITSFRRQARSANVSIADEEAFGFGAYAQSFNTDLAPEVIQALDLQRQIIIFAVNQLIEILRQESASDEGAETMEEIETPDLEFAINAVERTPVELLDPEIDRAGRGGGDRLPEGTFQIDPLVSAAVPGAVETLGFRVTFTGITSDLRAFLNALTNADLPVVIRSVEVEPAGEITAEAPPAAEEDPFETLFGGGGDDADTEADEEPSFEPVIAQVSSLFTVTFEYIDVVLETESTD
jgi:hypothetical protein